MSLSAADIRHIRALQHKKYRRETGLFVVEGVKTVNELIASNITLSAIYCTDSSGIADDVDQSILHLIKEKELERISGLRTPNKVLAVAKIPLPKPIDWKTPVILMLDGINDPGNMGTILRSAKWFGTPTVLCSEDCADPYDRKVVQSTMGALFHVNVIQGDLSELVKQCKTNGFTVLGAALNGESAHAHSRLTRTVLVIGSESHGINPSLLELCDGFLTIENKEASQRIESLNAAVATSILLYELTRSA